jgi:hypothetical protein
MIALPTLFLPCVLADWFLWRFRQRSHQHRAAAI